LILPHRVQLFQQTLKAHLPTVLRAFRYRNYRMFFMGQSVAITGGWMTFAALGWLLFRLTGDPFKLGLMGFFMNAPTFLLSPLGGVLVDRVSRRAVIIATQAIDLVTVSVLAALTLSGRIEEWHVLTLCTLLGITKGFELPARQALVVDIVDDRANLSNAIALNATIFHGARLIGPMLAGGLIIPTLGEGYCFLVHALAFLWAMPCFAALRPQPMQARERDSSVMTELREGFGYAYRHPAIRPLLLHITFFVLLGQSFNTLLPVFAETILGGDSRTYGLLLGASGFGAVLAAMRLASRESVLGLGRLIFISTLAFSVALLLFAHSTWILASVPLLVVAGFTSISVMVSCNTIIQTLVDDHLRGRVMSLLGMVFMGSLPLGALLYGKLAGLIGTPASVTLGAVGSALAALAFRAQLPSLRRIMFPLYVERGILPNPNSTTNPGTRPTNAHTGLHEL